MVERLKQHGTLHSSRDLLKICVKLGTSGSAQTFRLSTALVDIPAVSMPIGRSLKTCDICGIVLCDKTAHFRVAFYCGQPKAHLCNNHAV